LLAFSKSRRHPVLRNHFIAENYPGNAQQGPGTESSPNSIKAFQPPHVAILLSSFSFVLRIPSMLIRPSLLEIRVITKWNAIRGANNPAAKAART
jgi:hypothetical protein